MAFTAPKKSSFKRFVLLDNDAILAALSAIDGGQVDEVLRRRADDSVGGFEAGIKAGPANASGKRAKSRKVEDEMRVVLTRHATASKLLETLEQTNSMGKVEGAFTADDAAQVSVGMVIEMKAEILLHPLHEADQMLRSFIDVAPVIGEKDSAKELKQVLGLWNAVVGTGGPDSRILFEPKTSDPQEPRILMPVPRTHLEVELEDMVGELTVVAQIEQILGPEDHHPAMRLLRGAPQAGLERGALEAALPDVIEGIADLGIQISEDDVFIAGPAIVLRAICCYR